jgi:hypothetical protein
MSSLSTSMPSLYTDLAGQHLALLLEEAERERLASQARAARRRRRQRHHLRRPATMQPAEWC